MNKTGIEWTDYTWNPITASPHEWLETDITKAEWVAHCQTLKEA